jgi:hypothetical protein
MKPSAMEKQRDALQIDFKSQLTKMDNTVKNVLTGMGEIEKCIDAKFTTMQTNLTDMIEKKLANKTIVAQVAAVLGGDTSPFVIAASLKATMEPFINQVFESPDRTVTISFSMVGFIDDSTSTVNDFHNNTATVDYLLPGYKSAPNHGTISFGARAECSS